MPRRSGPPVRVGNKRVFTEEDVERMALHFHVRPNWKNRHVDDAIELQEVVGVKGLGLKVPFSVESIGPTDHDFARIHFFGEASLLARTFR